MKKFLSLALALTCAVSLLASCQKSGGEQPSGGSSAASNPPAASNTEAIANVTVPAKTPVIAGEEGICKGCGVATLSISYYDLGMTTGKMAAKILTGEADISTMPIEFTTATPKYNASMCETLGITPLEGYTAIAE